MDLWPAPGFGGPASHQNPSGGISHFRGLAQELGSARHGLVICRTPRRFRLSRDIVALPWQEIPVVIEELLA